MLTVTCVGTLRALGTARPLSEYTQQAWQSDSGLPQNTVRAIVQTRDGFLWLGTEAGLVRFDGSEFQVFDTTNTPALQSDTINALQEDAAGALWVGTPGGLLREQYGALQQFNQAQGLPSPVILTLFRSSRHRLLVLTPAGAAVLAGNTFRSIPGTAGLGMTEGASFATETGDGHLWIAGSSRAVLLSPECTPQGPPVEVGGVGELQSIAPAPDRSAGDLLWAGGAGGLVSVSARHATLNASINSRLPSPEVRALLAAPEGLWIGTGRGLALLAHGTLSVEAQLEGQRVERLFRDRAGSLWVATGEGIARLAAGGRLDRQARRASIDGVLAITEDREGSMWFGTDAAGLRVLRREPFSSIPAGDGLSASPVRAVFEDHAGTVWLGTGGGGLDRVTGGQAEAFRGKLPSSVVLALAETQSTASGGTGQYTLWAGTPNGMVSIRGTRTHVYTTADGLADDFVRSLYADRDGSLWIGTRNGLTHWSGRALRSYSRLDGLDGDLIGAILRDRADRLWVGTLGGLNRMVGDEFASALPGAAVTSLLEGRTGALWVGTQAGGLSRLQGDKVTRFAGAGPGANGLPKTIFGMLEDTEGNLWLSSRTGVDRVSLAALDAWTGGALRVPVRHYDTADGMRINEAGGGGHPAAWRAHDGTLWFATLNGVVLVHPGAALQDTVPPPAAIEQVSVDDRTIAPAAYGASSPVKVPAGQGRLTIRYAGLSLLAPAKVRYRYQLQGFDRDWIEAGSRRTAYYTNVPPGKYRFLVLAANSDGVWSETPAAVDFTVQPFFYQTRWFYLALVLVLAGLVYAVYRWRVHTVERQYQAVLGERTRIAREIHDTLAQGYVAMSVQLELAERLLATSVEAAARQLRQTRTMVRESLAEARSSIWNLRAQTDAETLPSLLAAHVVQLNHRSAGSPVIRFGVHGVYRPLARNVEDEVRRITQEAVANAVAHAEARLVTVSLRYDPQLLELAVSDDGVGLPPDATGAAQRGHFGLQGMRERTARIGGVLQIDKAEDSLARPGTRVLLQLALRRVPGSGASTDLASQGSGALPSGERPEERTNRSE